VTTSVNQHGLTPNSTSSTLIIYGIELRCSGT